MAATKFVAKAAVFALLLMLLVGSDPADAQPGPADVAVDHVRANAAALGLTAADVAEITVSDEVRSAHNGVTHVYLLQRHDGIAVVNGLINVSVAADGRVLHVGNRFVAEPGRGDRRPGPGPLGRGRGRGRRHQRRAGPGDRHRDRRRADRCLAGRRRCPTAASRPPTSRPSWCGSRSTTARSGWPGRCSSSRPTATTGGRSPSTPRAGPCSRPSTSSSMTTRRRSPTPPPAPAAAPTPVGPREPGRRRLVVPRVPRAVREPVRRRPGARRQPGGRRCVAVRLARHRRRRGTGVHPHPRQQRARLRRPRREQPGRSRDRSRRRGRARLRLPARPRRPAARLPRRRRSPTSSTGTTSSTTSCTATASTRPRATSRSTTTARAALGGDDVRAEAQDGSGRNNANFGTPVDGMRPRMQMFEWRSSAPNPIVVAPPSPIAGTYFGPMAGFGESLLTTGPITGEVVYVGRGCDPAYQGGQPLDPYLADPAGQASPSSTGAAARSWPRSRRPRTSAPSW